MVVWEKMGVYHTTFGLQWNLDQTYVDFWDKKNKENFLCKYQI